MNYESFSFLFFLVLLYSFCNLNSSPDYDPFSKNINISVETLLEDGCELISAPCGYGTYGKEINGHLVYYQFSPGKEEIVSAKGICIHIDSTEVESDLIPETLLPKKIEILIEQLLLEEVDSARIIVPLLEFGVQNIPYQRDSSLLFELHFEDINPLERTWCFIDQDHQVYSAQIDFKTGTNSNNKSIIIRTLELFISQKIKH